MIHTIYPYGSVNIGCIHTIVKKFDKFYCVDKCGKWLISESDYYYLKERGIKFYE